MPTYAGLRLTVDEFYALPDDGQRYELIDGVVFMSPSPTPNHQLVAKVLLRQLDNFVETNGLGLVLYETDIHLPTARPGSTVVYRPEIIFVAAPRVADIGRRIDFAPDLTVEVISPDSQSLDRVTKRADYEAAGVREYWLIDPGAEEILFLRLNAGRYAEIRCAHDCYESVAVPGFRLDLASVKAAFHTLSLD